MKDSVDRTIIGAIGGLIGGLAFIVTLQITNLVIKESYPKVLHIAHLFIPAGQDHTFWGKVVAHIAHFIVSSLLGILFVNIYRVTGRDWVTSKGLIFGGAAWVIIFGVMGKILNLPQKGSITLAFVMIVAHLIFGVATSWSVYLLSEKAKL